MTQTPPNAGEPIALLPCPFCGGRAAKMQRPHNNEFGIECANDCTRVHGWFLTLADAEAAWNIRAKPNAGEPVAWSLTMRSGVHPCNDMYVGDYADEKEAHNEGFRIMMQDRFGDAPEYMCWEVTHPQPNAGMVTDDGENANQIAWVAYHLSPAMREGKIRDKLIEMGWTPPAAPKPECATPEKSG